MERERREPYEAQLRKEDDDFFNSLSQMKQQKRQQKLNRNEYKQMLKESARNEREGINDFMNLGEVYESSKSSDRDYYEKNITDKKAYQNNMKQMMSDVKKRIGFEVSIGDDAEKQYAFINVLKYLHKIQKDNFFPYIYAHEIGGRGRWFTVNNSNNVDAMIGHILGTIDITQQSSDDDPDSIDAFQPDVFKIEFINKTGRGKNTRFHGDVRDPETNKVRDDEFELPEEFRDAYDGSFFPYINLSPIDLSALQIFNSVDKNNLVHQ